MGSIAADYWQPTSIIFFLSSYIILILSMIVLRFTLDRRVRKTLPPDKLYISYMDANFGVGRAISFGGACVFDYANNSEKLRYYYNNVDVRSIATPFDKFFSHCMVISGGIGVLAIPFVFIIDYYEFF